MNRTTLIGQVAALYLKQTIATDDTEGTARFIIDCLTAEQTAAIAQAVLADTSLSNLIEMKLPRHFLSSYGLPESILTNERATLYRNAACDKSALLIANTGDDEEQSLKELVPIGAPQLQAHSELWVRAASAGLAILPEHRAWWEKALSGLRDLHLLSLDRLAAYVLSTRFFIQEEGLPIIGALGAALPALQMPRDSAYFQGLNEKVRTHAHQWKRLYAAANLKRACFLTKQTPTGLLLNKEELKGAFDKVKDGIHESLHSTVLSFINAPSGWNPAAANLAECEWESVKPLFDGLRREKFSLGQATINFYDEREAELLSTADKDYLKRLINRKTTEAEEEDERFYDVHRNELKEDRKLKSAWDKFIFGRPKEFEDFLAGLAISMESLFAQDMPVSQRRLHIRGERRTKKDLKDLNVDAGLYFATRYRGVRTLLGSAVTWDVGDLFNFVDLVETWRTSGLELNTSSARAALQIKFIITLEVDLLTGSIERYSTQLIWKFSPETVASEFVHDWSRLKAHPLVACRANRETTSSKGTFQTVDLSNVKTFLPVYDRDRGSFVAAYRKTNDLALKWLANLQEARDREFIDQGTAQDLKEAFEAFQGSYTSAIRGFAEEGVTHPSLLNQLKKYSILLQALCRNAKGDRNRDLLLRPLLQIGTVAVEGGRTMAVVAPWHPLRIAAIVIKAQLVGNFVKYLLTSESVFFGDTRLFFDDMQEELKHPFYPEIVLGWHENKAELLSVTDTVGDYSLHESPLISPLGTDDTNENPTEAANRVLELVQRYLTLHPHEQSNLSVVLYNCDSARLPQAVVDKIGTARDDDEDVRCQIIVRHRDSKRLRGLYEKIIEASDTDVDSFNASEATRDFMARLRIGIMADQAPVPDPKDGRPNDLVFSQDVIARHARIEWYPETVRPVDISRFIPARWSRRRPAAKDDMKSVVYLCCPVQSKEGWSFLTAITSFLKGDWNDEWSRRLLPARQLDFQDPITATIFRETHDLANWVINYDELLDRRQLLNQQVRVIRYKQSTTQGRNVVISSKAPLGLLQSMVLRRVKDLNLGLSNEEYRVLADRFIQDANDISGDIVLRAAKRGRNASELIGIVLSQFLIKNEIGLNRHFGWYFLDDYADWLGQREEQIADILVLSPEQTPEGKLRLVVVVSEAKYIDASSLAAKRKESQKQLRDTINRIDEALFGNPKRLDRDLWLARLSDMILDGVQLPANARINLGDWRRAIREGECEIYLRGYSHIFVSGPNDAADTSSFAVAAGLENAYQEVYSRAQVRDLVLQYVQNADPMPLRLQNADKNVWEYQTYRLPVERAPIIAIPRAASPIAEPDQTVPVSPNGQGERVPAPHETGSIAPTLVELQSVPGTDSNSNGAHWAYPSIASLVGELNHTDPMAEDDQAWLRQIESQAKGALQQFQLQSKLVTSVLTPNAALLKFAGSTNLTVEQVIKRRSEFLTTHRINIISVRPEPGVISLAIERPQRQVIHMRDLWSRWHPDSANGNQELLIAVREDDGSLLFLSPGKQHAPHTLIAGATGSGKSVLMQNIIMAIAATNTPEQAKIILIDPKQGVDYFQFEGLPHLDGGIIDQQELALQHLQSLVTEMDARYTKLRNARVSNLDAYNRKVSASERLPHIWLIHDEFADWMMVEEYKQEVVSAVSRLGVKARAAGIFLIFVAQRPDANVMPVQLRDNLGNRLILRVASEGTSEIALGEKGAERLLGRGHLLAKLEGATGLCYAQVPAIDHDFMEGIVSIIH